MLEDSLIGLGFGTQRVEAPHRLGGVGCLTPFHSHTINLVTSSGKD